MKTAAGMSWQLLTLASKEPATLSGSCQAYCLTEMHLPSCTALFQLGLESRNHPTSKRNVG